MNLIWCNVLFFFFRFMCFNVYKVVSCIILFFVFKMKVEIRVVYELYKKKFNLIFNRIRVWFLSF